jgi:general secretion pathway protein J
MTGSPVRRSGDIAGFTLLELLIAIALVGLLTTILFAAFRFEARQLDRQATRLNQSAEVPVAYGFVEARLADARPVQPVNLPGVAIAFDGSASHVSFVSASPESARQGGLYLFSIDLASTQLRVRWQRFEGLLPVTDSGAAEKLLDRVRRVELTYFGSAEPGADPTWHGQWRNMGYLPALVRLELEFIDGEHPPELVIAPRLAPLQRAATEASR